MNGPRPLFDTDRLTETACPIPHCPALRLPGQDRVPTCHHDLDPEAMRRPRRCLNAHQPQHANLPDGF